MDLRKYISEVRGYISEVGVYLRSTKNLLLPEMKSIKKHEEEMKEIRRKWGFIDLQELEQERQEMKRRIASYRF